MSTFAVSVFVGFEGRILEERDINRNNIQRRI